MLLLRFLLVSLQWCGEVFTLCVFLPAQAFPKLVFLSTAATLWAGRAMPVRSQAWNWRRIEVFLAPVGAKFSFLVVRRCRCRCQWSIFAGRTLNHCRR